MAEAAAPPPLAAAPFAADAAIGDASAAASAPRAPLAALPLAPHVRQALLSAGYATAGDLEHLDADALAATAGLTPPAAAEALAAALGARAPGWRLSGAESARALLEAERARPRVATACAELDALLGGGVATGAVTEFCECRLVLVLCPICPLAGF